MNKSEALYLLEKMEDVLLDVLESIYLFAEKYDLTNTQSFIEFADELNEYSVKY